MKDNIVNSGNIDINLFKEARVTDIGDVSNVSGFKGGKDRRRHLRETLGCVTITGNILEFGVYKGGTINIISDRFKSDTCWGFDSFEGLPEDWVMNEGSAVKFKQGHFKTILPKVNDNVNLVKGWFDKTLPEWIKIHQQPIKLLHIDCDLYSSTKIIFETLNKYIRPGTVIIFDELCSWNSKSYPNWENGEWKALVEWMSTYGRSFEILHRNSYMQAAIKIHE